MFPGTAGWEGRSAMDHLCGSFFRWWFFLGPFFFPFSTRSDRNRQPTVGMKRIAERFAGWKGGLQAILSTVAWLWLPLPQLTNKIHQHITLLHIHYIRYYLIHPLFGCHISSFYLTSMLFQNFFKFAISFFILEIVCITFFFLTLFLTFAFSLLECCFSDFLAVLPNALIFLVYCNFPVFPPTFKCLVKSSFYSFILYVVCSTIFHLFFLYYYF